MKLLYTGATMGALKEDFTSDRRSKAERRAAKERRAVSNRRAADERRELRRVAEDEEVVGEHVDFNFAEEKINLWMASIKRLFDIFAALSGIMVLSPLLIGVAFIIKYTSKGNIIFSQKRVGKGGKLFSMYKFRSMINNAEELKKLLAEQNEASGPVFKIKNDPRITPIGKFIRKYSIDELPQLINVVLGHMSIVGPRPALPNEVMGYKHWQTKRFAVKPGLTCIWQVSGRSNVNFVTWMRMDIRYIKKLKRTILYDIKLIIKTIKVVIFGDGAY